MRCRTVLLTAMAAVACGQARAPASAADASAVAADALPGPDAVSGAASDGAADGGPGGLDAAFAPDARALHDGGGTPPDAGPCDPTAMVLPNQGLFEEPGTGTCPSGMVSIAASPAYCVDRFEASLVLVTANGSTVSWSPYFHPGARRVRAVSIRGAVPQAYIDGTTAERACHEAGKRLCTDGEWLRACRGPNGFTYPYGDTRMVGVCNDHRAVHPIIELFPNDPTFTAAHLDNACVDQLPMSLDRTGERTGCVTAESMYDMMGNLHEWTAAQAGTFRGGYYVDTVLNGPGCLYVTTAHVMSYWDYSTGFRCCADAP